MKKLDKINLPSAVFLEEQELKTILGGSGSDGGSGSGDNGSSGSGGYGSSGYSNICAARGDLSLSGGITLCTNDINRAIAHAGDSGWWCCNCQEAIEACAHLM